MVLCHEQQQLPNDKFLSYSFIYLLFSQETISLRTYEKNLSSYHTFHLIFHFLILFHQDSTKVDVFIWD